MSLSYWYPFSELLTGVLVVLVFLLYTTAPVSYLLLMYALLSLLIIIFLIDAKYGLIPFPLVVSTTGLAFLLSLIYPERSLLDSIIAGSVIGGFFFLLFALTRGKGMGFGDVVYAFFMGFLLGLPQAVSALYIAFLTGAAVALILVLLGRKKLKGGTIAFGPFLIIGTIVALFWGDILLAYALQFLS